ncbi:MAG: acyl carrier protein phosphodiesterase [Candidatus Azotimanducaceae bacterium]|jgi:acyl carrier protein phosphodiesterase|tara:strand:- start:499 stop:1119 length:621 start_codon:yes stop_codon:yes gene_type:complete
MNFLAHCVLADHAAERWQVDRETRQGLLAGAVIADFSKGPVNPTWPQALQAGVRLHRRIDAFSNTQHAIKTTCERFPPEYRRYAPIFVDLLADYFLSISWDHLHSESKTIFSAKCYAALTEYDGFLPAHGQRFLQYAQQRDLFANYDQWENIQRGLGSVLQRLNKEAWFADVDACAASLRESALPDFLLYYAELEQQLSSWHELLE